MAIDNTSSAASASTATSGIFQTARDEQGDARFFSDLVNASRVETQATDSLTQGDLATQANDAKATEDQFLTLLLAQMNNQDPLNPLDNAQVTTQLAQISTVSGIEEMNSTMEALLNKINSSSPVDSANMIDRQVLISGDSLSLSGEAGESVNAGAELSNSASSVNVEIFDAQGDSVRTIALGPQAAGLVTFDWDGLDNDGESLPATEYRFQVSAESGAGVQIAAPMMAAKVTGVTQANDSLSYRLTNGATIPSDQVRGVF
ncbi:MAG: flagellar hook assembly protein FlgD [Burkholderiaceae bacterium]